MTKTQVDFASREGIARKNLRDTPTDENHQVSPRRFQNASRKKGEVSSGSPTHTRPVTKKYWDLTRDWFSWMMPETFVGHRKAFLTRII
jgi:hypothetical protein